MALVIALALAAQAAKLITFANDAAPMERVCRDLASKTGLDIFPAGDLKDEVVEVDVRDVSVDDLLTRLDDVLLAKAERTKEGWKLVADEKRRNELRRRALQERTARIEEAQRRIRQELAKERAFDARKLFAAAEKFGNRFSGPDVRVNSDMFDAMAPLQHGAPGNRPLRALLTELPAATLAAISDEGVLAFSEPPKRFQLPLGELARECIEATAKEQNAWAATYHSDGKYESPQVRIWGDPRASTEPMDPAQTRLFVKAHNGTGTGLPAVAAIFADAQGNTLLSTMADLAADVLPSPVLSALPGEPILHLSSRAEADLLGYYAGRHSQVGATGEARKWIRAPDVFEPLGFAVSEYLAGTARFRRANLVACIPDEAFDATRDYTDAKGKLLDIRPSQLIHSLRKYGASVEASDGWLTVRPKFDAVRIDRVALAALLRREEQDGCLRLAALCDFAGSMKSNLTPRLFHGAADAILPGAPSLAGIMDWFPLRLLAKIPVEQRAGLFAGETLIVEALPPTVQRMLEATVFERQNWNVHLPRPGRPRARYAGAMLEQEPTEVLPEGISRDATVVWRTVVTRAKMVGAVSSEDASTDAIDLVALAVHELSAQYPELAARAAFPVSEVIHRVRPGYRTTYNFEWQLGSGAFLGYLVPDFEFDLRTAPTTLKDLPDDYVRELGAYEAGFIKERGAATGGPGGGTPPQR